MKLFLYMSIIYHLGITQISMSWLTFSCFFVHLLPWTFWLYVKMKKRWIACLHGSDNLYFWHWMVISHQYVACSFQCCHHPCQLPHELHYTTWLLKATKDIVYSLHFLSMYFKFQLFWLTYTFSCCREDCVSSYRRKFNGPSKHYNPSCMLKNP